MKRFILTSTVILCVIFPTFCQNLNFDIKGLYARSIKKETLNRAKSFSDIIPDYPVNWIDDYISTSITSTTHGKTIHAAGKNIMLSKEQMDVLHNAELASDIVIDIDYTSKNAVTNNLVKLRMHISFTVVPEKQAEFIGGREQMMKYLEEKGMDKISKIDPKKLKPSVIKFMINEKGEVENAKIAQTTGFDKIDKLLLNAINTMPRWKPAQDANGTNVKQEFELTAGIISPGC